MVGWTRGSGLQTLRNYYRPVKPRHSPIVDSSPAPVPRQDCPSRIPMRVRDYLENPALVQRLSPAAARKLCIQLLAVIKEG